MKYNKFNGGFFQGCKNGSILVSNSIKKMYHINKETE